MAFPKSLLIAMCLLFASSTYAQGPSDEQAIRAALARWNDRASHADLDGVMQQFDDAGEVLLVGSAPGEVYRGKAAIREWLGSLLSHDRFSWDLSNPVIDVNGDTAWVFVDGTMTVTDDKGGVMPSPYRFSGVLVKRKDAWKWRLFHGSVPGQEQ
jgi:uncharacterized protein (TIGR02246 family)